MIRLALLALVTIPGFASAWPDAEYRRVVAYYYNEEGESFAPILQEGKPHASVLKSRVLRAAQAKALLSAIGADTPKHNQYLCHKPRHAFVFEPEGSGEKLALEVCFECLTFRYSPWFSKEPWPWLDFVSTAKLVTELGLPLGPNGETVEDIQAKVHELTGALERTKDSMPSQSLNGARKRAR